MEKFTIVKAQVIGVITGLSLVLAILGILFDILIEVYTGHSVIQEYIRPLFN